MYYKVIINNETNRYEFHTGSDREEVRQGKSLNRAVLIDSPNAAEIMFDWFNAIELYELKQA